MWPKSANQVLTAGLGVSKDWHKSARTLFNMAAAGLRAHWVVKVGCGICSSNWGCVCVEALVFSHCSALLAIFWAWFSRPPAESVHTISFQYIAVNKLSVSVVDTVMGLSKFSFKSEGLICSAVEWAAGRQPSAVIPPWNCLSRRESHYPKSHLLYWASLNPEISQHEAERPAPHPNSSGIAR